MQQRLAAISQRIQITPMCQKQLQNLVIFIRCGQVQNCVAVTVLHLAIDPFRQNDLPLLHLTQPVILQHVLDQQESDW